MSVEQQNVSVGESVAVACNVSGLPQPDLHWINKRNGQTLVRVVRRGRATGWPGVAKDTACQSVATP